MQNVIPKTAEGTALISDVVADSPHKVTYVMVSVCLNFSKRKMSQFLGHSWVPTCSFWLVYENTIEVELAIDSYKVTLMSCQSFFNHYFYLETILYIL
jgi:hypothetical protein